MGRWQPFQLGLRALVQLTIPALRLGSLLVFAAVVLGDLGCTNRAATGEIHLANGLEQLALVDTSQALYFVTPPPGEANGQGAVDAGPIVGMITAAS